MIKKTTDGTHSNCLQRIRLKQRDVNIHRIKSNLHWVEKTNSCVTFYFVVIYVCSLFLFSIISVSCFLESRKAGKSATTRVSCTKRELVRELSSSSVHSHV